MHRKPSSGPWRLQQRSTKVDSVKFTKPSQITLRIIHQAIDLDETNATVCISSIYDGALGRKMVRDVDLSRI